MSDNRTALELQRTMGTPGWGVMQSFLTHVTDNMLHAALVCEDAAKGLDLLRQARGALAARETFLQRVENAAEIQNVDANSAFVAM